jgi:hypothetical protein
MGFVEEQGREALIEMACPIDTGTPAPVRLKPR